MQYYAKCRRGERCVYVTDVTYSTLNVPYMGLSHSQHNTACVGVQEFFAYPVFP